MQSFLFPLALTRYVKAFLWFAGLSLSSASLVSAQNKAPSPEVYSAAVDLNGDGARENIDIVKDKKSRGAFFLSVNGITFPKSLYNYDDTKPGFRVVKIDRAGKTRQIALHIAGPNDDGETFFYRWNGKTLLPVGDVPNAESVVGNGAVYGGVWMEFWNCRQKYAFNPKTQTLTFVRQPVYRLDVPAAAKESFSVFREHKTGSASVASVTPGSKIRLISFWTSTTQPKDSVPENRWFLVRTATGQTGWARSDTFTEKVEGLPIAG